MSNSWLLSFLNVVILSYMLQVTLKGFNITTLSWDTRTIKSGDWYIPNIGETFDGHDFINAAFEKGAKGSFCQIDRKDKVDPKWQDKVLFYDTIEQALHDLVTSQISAIRTLNSQVRIVTITGTSGKTTTREMMVYMFSKFGKVLSAQTNYNTFWGNAYVLSEFDNHDFVVLETGLGYQNEVLIQNRAIAPDISMLLNIGHAHAGLAGGVEGVYIGKKAIVDIQVKGNRPTIINVDDPVVAKVSAEYKSYEKLYTVGRDSTNTVSYRNVELTPKGTSFILMCGGGEQKVMIKALGEKYVYNAMLSICGGVLLGKNFKDLCTALEGYDSFAGRFQIIHLSDAITLINDAYNANPTSFENGLATFASVWDNKEYKRILVLGDMGELGDIAEKLHVNLGEYIMKLGLTVDFYVGQYGQLIGAKSNFENVEQVIPHLKALINKNKNQKIVVYCKASNSKRLYTLANVNLLS